jgi:hypothetical protein
VTLIVLTVAVRWVVLLGSLFVIAKTAEHFID